VAAGHVGGAGQAEVLQRGRREAGGVPLFAEHDRPHVVPGDPGQPRLARGVEPPLQVVPLDHHRAGNLPGGGPLRGGPDIDQRRACLACGERLLRGQPVEPGAGRRQDLVDGTRARRRRTSASAREIAACHQSSAPSVPIATSPPEVRSYLVIADSGGEYACTLTATEPAAELRTSWGPKDRTFPAGTGLAADAIAPRSATYSSSSPHTTPNAPLAPPWSWNPVDWPGSQLISHSSSASSTRICSYQRPSGSRRTLVTHSAGAEVSRRTSAASCRGVSRRCSAVMIVRCTRRS